MWRRSSASAELRRTTVALPEVVRPAFVSGEQSSVGTAVKDWLLGTQAAPACEAGAFIRGRLMTADAHDRRSGRRAPIEATAKAEAHGKAAKPNPDSRVHRPAPDYGIVPGVTEKRQGMCRAKFGSSL